jgi:hypothetical protein
MNIFIFVLEGRRDRPSFILKCGEMEEVAKRLIMWLVYVGDKLLCFGGGVELLNSA